MNNGSSVLETMFAMAQQGAPWRICLWDWSGFTRQKNDLALDFDLYQVHHNPFCEYAKSTAQGLRRCLRCRQAAGAKALRGGPYQGRCHLGVTEIVHPVRLGDQVLGILFGGQMRLPGSPGKGLGPRALRLGLDPAKLKALSSSLGRADAAGQAELGRRLEAIAKFIVATVRAEPGQSLSGAKVRSPVLQELPSMRGAARRAWLAKSGIEIARLEYHKPQASTRIARRLGVSLSMFCRSFREHSGRSFKDYLLELRIKAAQRLLIESPSGIGYIGAEVGFKDPNFFSRVFKAKMGLSPRDFREKHWQIHKKNSTK